MADDVKWYVLRDLGRSHSKNPAWRLLADGGFRVFTPMRERMRTVGSRKVRETVPVISDLLFVRSSVRKLDEAMVTIPTLQYRFVKGAPYRTAMTVPDADMERFIQAVQSSPRTTYYLPEELTADMIGREVRIVDGPLAGCEGKLLKVRGSVKRRLLISLRNYLTAAVEVEKHFIEFV